MQEIEVKILEIDRDDLEKKLLSLGAEKHFEGELHAIFYDFSDNRIINNGSVLRLRKEGNETKLTFKSPVPTAKAKVMNEYETGVENINEMIEILKHLELKRIEETRKLRTEYLFEKCKVVIDDYLDELAHIPVFIEIEAPTIDQLSVVVNRLGYSEEDCKNWNTYELAKHYKDLDEI